MGVLRLILAWLVIIGHSQAIFGWTGIGGSSAVIAFFIISGYYMSLILDEKYRGLDRVWLFYSNRALRLFPPYFAVLLIYVLLDFIGQPSWAPAGRVVHGAEQAIKYATDGSTPSLFAAIPNLTFFGADIIRLFITNLNDQTLLLWRRGMAEGPVLCGTYRYLVMPHIWSLGVELVFYALSPFIARLRLFWLILLLLLCVALQNFLSHAWMDLAWKHLPWPWNIGYFILGMVAYRIFKIVPYIPKLILLPLSCVPLFLSLVPVRNSWWVWLLFAISVPPLFMLTKSSRLDRTLGNLSYPVYLCHFLFAWPCAVSLGNFGSIAALGISCLVAWTIIKLVDKPIDRWRQRRVQISQDL